MSSKPFNETAIFVPNAGFDTFFISGSSRDIGNGTFTTRLTNKVQIRLSFPIKNPVRMLGNSASIYYLNPTLGQWNIPQKSLNDHVGPFDKYRFPTDSATLGSAVSWNAAFGGGTTHHTFGSPYIEDSIGFDCFGNSLASGSLDARRQIITGINYGNFGTQMPTSMFEQTKGLTGDFPKSVSRNSDYDAGQETFTLPITEPFLIEKVIVEVPFAFGDSWFRDTTAFCPCTSSTGDYLLNGAVSDATRAAYFYDEGGPRVTLALFSQKNYGTGTIRDLICHDVITNEDDAKTTISIDHRQHPVSTSPSLPFLFVHPNGLNEASSPTSVFPVTGVLVSGKKTFTGSVAVRSICSITNGLKSLGFMGDQLVNVTVDQGIAALNDLMKRQTLPASASYLDFRGIDPIGRGMTGFAPSGGSIFGKEYVTSQGKLDANNNIRSNPLYVKNQAERDAIISDFNSKWTTHFGVGNGSAYFMSMLTLGTNQPSPYLVRPGESLVLSVAKHRPAFSSFKSSVKSTPLSNGERGIGSLISSSYYNDIGNPQGHDVQLTTGSVNITLYGCYVSNGGQYIP